MKPQYFIDNIGNNLLPHYERMNLLLYLKGYNEDHKISEKECSKQLTNLFYLHEKYVTEESKGIFWVKISFFLNPEGKTFLSHYKYKVEQTLKELQNFIEGYSGEGVPRLDPLIEEINAIARTKFKSLADFMLQRAILNGYFQDFLYCFKSLSTFSSAYRQFKWKCGGYKKISEKALDNNKIKSEYQHEIMFNRGYEGDSFFFFVLLKELCSSEVAALYFPPVDIGEDARINMEDFRPQGEPISEEQKPSIPINFLDEGKEKNGN